MRSASMPLFGFEETRISGSACFFGVEEGRAAAAGLRERRVIFGKGRRFYVSETIPYGRRGSIG